MDTMRTILSRRSIRRYSAEPISDEKLDRILAAGLAAASGRGIRPVELIAVTEREVLVQLSQARTTGAQMLEEATACIVVIASDEKSDTWIEDASLAMGNMMLEAEELGIGGCWVQGRGREAAGNRTTEKFVFELLGVPRGYRLEAMLALGNPAEEKPAYIEDNLPWSKVHRGTF